MLAGEGPYKAKEAFSSFYCFPQPLDVEESLFQLKLDMSLQVFVEDIQATPYSFPPFLMGQT